MISHIQNALELVNIHLFLFSGVLFILGLVLADVILEKNIRWMIAYPMWIYTKIDKLMKWMPHFFLSFLFIVVFNSVNLFIGFASGFSLILPVLLPIWTGINIGVVLRKVGGNGHGSFLLVFLNPVAIFELPAGWIAFSLGLEMAVRFIITPDYTLLADLFVERLSVFIWLVLPLLAMAGLLESVFIHIMQNKIQEKDSS